MQIHLDPRNFRFTAPIRKHASEKMMGLRDLANILTAHVILSENSGETPDQRFTVKAHLAVPGPDVHAQESGHDPFVALNKVCDRLARQLRKRHTVLIDKRRQKVQRVVEMEKKLGA